tara:strand:- start:625 stop:1515 length:891 start_codon:yes stop_codon:yes gene_type:complete
MKIVISIFCLPYEIDELENTINQLKRASYYLENKKIEWYLDVTMCTANDMVNWSKSSLPKKYFEDKLLKISTSTDWCVKYFRTSDTIKGCVSQRRESLDSHKDAHYFIWLDTDIIFDERTLSYVENSINAIKDIPYSIITPELVRIWDNTWDVLVNENFIKEKVGYQKIADPYKCSGLKGDVSLERVENTSSPQSRFKFAGGWFTCISASLLNKVGVPKSFGHYGYEDTFIMVACEKLVRMGEDIQQFKIKNLVVCENYKYRNVSHYINNISVYDRREEFKKFGYDSFNDELKKII